MDIMNPRSDREFTRLDLKVWSAVTKSIAGGQSGGLQDVSHTIESTLTKGAGRAAIRLLDRHLQFDLLALLTVSEQWLSLIHI